MLRSFKVIAALTALLAVATLALAQPLVYVTDPGSNSLTAIDSGNNTIVRVLSALTSARALAISPDGTRIYVAASGTGSAGEVATIDGTKVADKNQNPLIAKIRVGGKPIAVAYDARTGLLYVADASSNQGVSYDLTAINPDNPQTVATYKADAGLSAMALSPDGQTLALASTSTPEVTLYNLRLIAAGLTGKTVIALPSKPRALVFSANGDLLWIATDGGFSAYSFAAAVLVSKTLSGGTTSVAVAPRAKRVYFGAGTGKTIYAYDPALDQVTNIATPGAVQGLSLSADGTRLYAALHCGNCGAAVIATDDGQLVKQVHFGSGPETAGQFAGPGAIHAPNAATAGQVSEQASGSVKASDNDNRALSYAVILAPPAGTLSFNATGDFTYTPPAGFSGVQSFVWQASAASGEGAPNDPFSRPITETLEIHPSVSAIGDQKADPDSTLGPLSFTLAGSTPLTIKLKSSVSGLVAANQIIVSDGCGTTDLDCTLSIPVKNVANGTTKVTLTAVGPEGLTASTQFTITVGNGSNDCGCGGFGLAGLGGFALLSLVVVGLRRRRHERI